VQFLLLAMFFLLIYLLR